MLIILHKLRFFLRVAFVYVACFNKYTENNPSSLHVYTDRILVFIRFLCVYTTLCI